MFRRRDDARARRAANPFVWDGVLLEMHVGQPVLLEHLHGPIVRLLQARRTCQPRPDRIRQIFEIAHQFAVLANLLQYLLIGGGKRAPFFSRRPGAPHPRPRQQSQRHHHQRHFSSRVFHRAPRTFFSLCLLCSNLCALCVISLSFYFLFARSFRLGGAFWHFAQKQLLRPATITLRIFPPQRKHFLPSLPYARWRR